MKLYELPQAWQEIEEELIENGGELTPELEEKIRLTEQTLTDKTTNICCLIRQSETQAGAVNDEIERLVKLRDARKNTAARLKSYLLNNLNAMGRDKVATPLFSVRVQRNGQPAVRWSGDGFPPANLCKPPDPPPPPALDYRKVVQMAKEHTAETADNPLILVGTGPLEGIELEYGQHIRVQ